MERVVQPSRPVPALRTGSPSVPWRPLLATDSEAVLFSAKTALAALLAYYIALSVGLAQPGWAITTVYLTAQPLAGTVLAKAFFRLLGTWLGGAVSVILLPTFANEPLAFACAMACWIGFCACYARLDRTPRADAVLLGGYTASIICFPNVLQPGAIFDIAILRVQEISIAIAMTALVHGLVFPRTVAARLRVRVAAMVADAEAWSRRALAGSRDPVLEGERRRIAADIDELETLSFNLAFDTERLLPPVRVVRALAAQLSWVLPLQASIEDRIDELRRARGGELPDSAAALLARVEAWLADGIRTPERDAEAHALVAEAMKGQREVTASASPAWEWSDLLHLSLLFRLMEMVTRHRAMRELHDLVEHQDGSGVSREVTALVAASTGRSLHLEFGYAMRSALATFCAIVATCLFWIATAWPNGGTAALIVGIACALVGGMPAPAPAASRFLLGATYGTFAALLYGYVVLPRVSDFTLFAAVLVPGLLIVGAVMARLPLALVALGGLITFDTTVGLSDTYLGDFAGTVNGALGLLIGLWVAVLVIRLFYAAGTGHAVERLLRAAYRDVAARADGEARHPQRWASRMIDRAALIAVRAGPAAKDHQPTVDALRGMRIGHIAGELHRLGHTAATDAERGPLLTALAGVADHFRTIEPSRNTPASPAVLTAIDAAMNAFVADPRHERQREGLVLLTGLRRNLFADAPAWSMTRAAAT